MTSPTMRTVLPSVCRHGEPVFQSETFSMPQYCRVTAGSVIAWNTFSGVEAM